MSRYKGKCESFGMVADGKSCATTLSKRFGCKSRSTFLQHNGFTSDKFNKEEAMPRVVIFRKVSTACRDEKL